VPRGSSHPVHPAAGRPLPRPPSPARRHHQRLSTECAPGMSGPELAVVLLISVPVLTLLLWRLWYGKASAAEQALLAQQTLTHFTSTRAGAAIDLGAGLVELTPRRGVRGGIAELAHLNWRGVFDHRYRAVYLYRSHPDHRATLPRPRHRGRRARHRRPHHPPPTVPLTARQPRRRAWWLPGTRPRHADRHAHEPPQTHSPREARSVLRSVAGR
jgi:hypothetical protein